MRIAAKVVLTAVLAAAAWGVSPPPAQAATSLAAVDTAGNVGSDTSVVLDAAGNPVISYFDVTNGDLKVAHCNDPGCVGGGDSLAAVDTAGDVGLYTSLVLDAAGNPVISYFDDSNGDLKVAHCNDPGCVGGGDSLAAVDTAGNVGFHTSLVLDAAGNPVISYQDRSNTDLKVAHCNDPDCAGGDDSLAAVDTAGNIGFDTSLVLDAAGNPVISYFDVSNLDLKVAHCNDPGCVGGGDSLAAVDTAGNVGFHTSLVLDAAGNPVISYHDQSNGDLKVAHCNDPGCTGGDDSLAAVDTAGNVGPETSLVLDAAGNPVISYHDSTNGDLKLAHCNDPGCVGGDDSLAAVDTAGTVGRFTSLVLDAAGNPVISYQDRSNSDLKLAHCDTVDCAPVDATAPVITANVAGTLGDDGWYVGDVTVTWTVTDDESAITETTGCDPATIDADTSGVTLTCQATSAGGTASGSVTIKRDATAPTVTCGAPPAFLLNQADAAVSATVTDAPSGPAASLVTAPADTSSVGVNSTEVTGVDNAGNQTTVGCDYDVRYAFAGFFDPIDPTAVNIAKAGRTVPVKWQLTDANGAPVSDPASFSSLTSTTSACSPTQTPDQIEIYAGHSGLQYLGDGVWQFNWKTPKGYAGDCRTLKLNLDDGTTHTAEFRFT